MNKYRPTDEQINKLPTVEQMVDASDNAQSVPDFDGVDFTDLMGQRFDDLWQPVEGIIAEGLTILCGGSKLGKSWICLDLAYCVATGKPYWGHRTNPCPVLYLALEDSRRRLQNRNNVLKLNRDEIKRGAITYVTSCRTMDDGFADQADSWISAHGGKCLVIVDVLQKIRGKARRSDGDAYQTDYRTVSAIKAIADKHRAAIVCVHHTKKGSRIGSDIYESMSGSNGIMGVADTAIMINRERGEQTAEIELTGRDVWSDSFTIKIDEDLHWHAVRTEDIEREQYESNPVVKHLRALVAENPEGGRISYGDFQVRCLTDFPYKDSKAFVRALNEGLATKLQVYDKILIDTGVQTYRTTGEHAKGFSYKKL